MNILVSIKKCYETLYAKGIDKCVLFAEIIQKRKTYNPYECPNAICIKSVHSET